MSGKTQFLCTTAAAFVAIAFAAHAENPMLAATPPMGWNSWDPFGTGVTESEVKQNADYMAAHLKSHGWQYIVVDIQWSEPNAKSHGYRPNAQLNMDAYGRLIPAENRFPSAANGHGFQPLAAYIHSKGLKFGIHIMRGIPRRAWPLARRRHAALRPHWYSRRTRRSAHVPLDSR